MKIILSNSSQEPIYKQIQNQIRNEILNGQLMEGDMLPSIRSLAKDLKISVITTKRAYEELESEGYLETVPGKGTFIASHNKEFIREKLLSEFEENLLVVIKTSRDLNMTKEELQNMIDILYEE